MLCFHWHIHQHQWTFDWADLRRETKEQFSIRPLSLVPLRRRYYFKAEMIPVFDMKGFVWFLGIKRWDGCFLQYSHPQKESSVIRWTWSSQRPVDDECERLRSYELRFNRSRRITRFTASSYLSIIVQICANDLVPESEKEKGCLLFVNNHWTMSQAKLD